MKNQHGFRKQKSTKEAILGLPVIIEKQIKKNKIAYLYFLDLEKAFPNATGNRNWTTRPEDNIHKKQTIVSE